LHEKDELFSMWGPDIAVVPRRSALLQFTLATLGFVGFGFLVKAALIPDRPAVAREYPFSGLLEELGGMEENKVRMTRLD
jgi:NADH dehydrogenase (ubiquinone) 1 beta subcomplex subunit 8